MAETDPVEIVIEIIDRFSDELRELRAELERIDAMSLNIDLDIHGESEIYRTEAMLDAMARNRNVVVSTSVAGAQVPRLEGMQMFEAPPLPGDVPGMGGGDMFDGAVPFRDVLRGIEDPAEAARRSFRGVGRAINKFRPNIMQVWNALAAMIPVMVSLGAAAIGLAGAFIALGTAAAAIVGVGLLGWGTSASDSLQQVQQEAGQLAQILGEVLRPAATTFQPILSDWMEGAPRQVEKLVGPMQELTVFADTLAAAGSGFMDWVADVIQAMTSMEGIISQMALRFGRIAGTFLIEWMENLVRFAYENQTALIRLSHAVRELFGILLELSVVVAATLSTISPFIEVISFLADMLNTKLGRALVTGIALLLTLETVLGAVMGLLALQRAELAASAAAMLSKYVPAVMTAVAATNEWLASLLGVSTAMSGLLLGGVGILGAGLLANEIMTGNQPPPRGQSGTPGNTYVNIEGDVGRREMDRLLDEVPSTTQNEMSINEDMEQ